MGIDVQEINNEAIKMLEPRDNNRFDVLEQKIKALHKVAWRDKWEAKSDQYRKWLENFKEGEEQLNAMFLLSKFMYFGNDTIRELMVRVYQDLYKRPIISEIRKKNNNTTDTALINSLFESIQEKTRFLCVGNPSESSAHLLYFFRQENLLKRDLFISPHELFVHIKEGGMIHAEIVTKGIERIVLLDDFCGSGKQAKSFNDEFVQFLKEEAPQIHVSYFALFAIEKGLSSVENLSFDKVKAIFTLDSSYKCFSENSRFFVDEEDEFKANCKQMCMKYGRKLCSSMPLGYRSCQMLLGFHHNTPNNTLPIFYIEKNGWSPMFKRYAKIY